MVSLRLADPVPGAAYEAKLRASDSAGHTSEVIHRIAPGAWNQLVLPAAEDGLKDVSELRVAVRATARQTTPPASSSMRCKLEYSHGGRNLASSATVSASTSVETGGWSAGNLVDSASYSTATHRGYRSAAAGNQWIQLDLGDTRSIGTVYLHPVTTPAGEEPLPGKTGAPAAPGVQVSADGTNWTTIDAVAHRTGAAEAPQRLSFSPVNARFLRLTPKIPAPTGSCHCLKLRFSGPATQCPAHLRTGP